MPSIRILLCLISLSTFPTTLGFRLICDGQAVLIRKIRDDLGRIDLVKQLNYMLGPLSVSRTTILPNNLTDGKWNFERRSLSSDKASACFVKMGALQCIIDKLSANMSQENSTTSTCLGSSFMKLVIKLHNLTMDDSLSYHETRIWLSAFQFYLVRAWQS